MKLSVLAVVCQAAVALGGDGFRPDGSYDPQVPTPTAVLGFELGEKPARYADMVRYFETLEDASPLARLKTHGKTHEGRDLIHLVVSSKDNLARLESIREAIGTLADPRRELSSEELEALLENTPAIAYMAYSIHGDELSSSDAALRVAYELVAGRNPDIEMMRDELVVIIDPIENPDGRERFLGMTEAFAGAIPNPDPDDLSHTAFWPWGRGNHYFFDLNRDWFALVHPESRGRVGLLRDWQPQLVVDSHEMGSQSTYLFNPPRAPFNPNLPRSTRPWWNRFAADQARAFDEHGWSYYTRDWNEEFFPGYGSALPLYQGALAILYEQAGTEGGPITKRHGSVLEYSEAVHHHFVSSLANLRTATENRRELLEKYREARVEAIERGKEGPARAFYFTPRGEPARAARLASRLDAMGIEVERLAEAGTLGAARSFWKDGTFEAALPAGSFRVRLDQPDGLVARAVLEPHTPMADAFLAEEREHLERKKGTRVYDTTAWSPLLASGVEAFWSKKLDKLAWEPGAHMGPPPGALNDSPEAYGWIFDGSRDAAVVLASKLADRGFKVRFGEKPFELGERAYPRGSFLLRSEENPEGVREALGELAASQAVEVTATPTARIQKGPDLGGDGWPLLKPPRIAIAAGQHLDFTSVGAAWHLLGKEHSLRVSLVDVTRLGSAELGRYNVLVLPNAWGGATGYERALGEAGIEAVRSWVKNGGTLVGLASGAAFLARKEHELSSARLRGHMLEDFPAPRFGLDDAAIRALERLQGMGVGPDGRAVSYAGPYSEDSWPEELGIPGHGSPVLGPGTWAMLGNAGRDARERSPLRTLEQRTETSDDSPEPQGTPQSKEEQEAARERIDERLRRFMPSGALLRADLDPEHWLAYGAGSRVAVMSRARDSLLARDPVVTAGRFAAPDELHLGGLLWPEAAGRIALTAFMTRERLGRGQIVLFSDDPNFRGYFWGSQRLFLNAVLLGPGAGTTHPVPW